MRSIAAVVFFPPNSFQDLFQEAGVKKSGGAGEGKGNILGEWMHPRRPSGR